MPRPPVLFCDNLNALHMTVNPVFHARNKHIELNYQFVREKVELGLLVSRQISTTHQVADLFTKPMSKATLIDFRNKLSLQPQLCLREGIKAKQQEDKAATAKSVEIFEE